MAVMTPDDRRDLVDTLELWLGNANAGVECSKQVSPGIIALIKAPDDKPDPTPGSP